MKLYTIKLSSSDIAGGALLEISDTINKEFMNSAKEANSGQGYSEKKEVLAFFENSGTRDDFNEIYGNDITNVLHLNEEAIRILKEKELYLDIQGAKEKDIDEEWGIFIRSVIFVE